MDPNCQTVISPVRTLIVDDAPLMRKAIRRILSERADIEVAGAAANGREGLEMIRELKPDVVTLDMDMPVMNGLTTVKNIMVRYQIPIVIISSLVQDGYFAFEALRLGVMDFVPKPTRAAGEDYAYEEELIRMRVRMASGMQVNRMRRVKVMKGRPSRGAIAAPPPAVVVMGTTLAGPNTIMHTASQLSPDFPGAIVALQEIHPRLLAPFCACFNRVSPLEVIPVTGSCPLVSGAIYMCSTFTGAVIEPSPQDQSVLTVSISEVRRNPIDQLFESAARYFGPAACGALLTGVGKDGTEGMRRIKAAGGYTLAQEQDLCVYPNLVENAIRARVVDSLAPVRQIPDRLQEWAARAMLE